MVMQNSVLDPQDQRKTFSMEDSSALTVEFLRARLLSERSVSRSARQRADELAKRVIELEEQLRMVTLQRKMAEKATLDVLAILENQGISDVSDEFDLGSDLEITCDSSVSNAPANSGRRSTSSKVRRHGSDELSGSNVDSSHAPGRSLSWKGRLNSLHSLEKYMTSNMRRKSSFSSISSSPSHRHGKSCRQIKHRESRSVVEGSRDKPADVNCQENEAVFSSEGFPNGSDGGPNSQIMESEIREEDESELKLTNANHDADGCEREKVMEGDLGQQAQHIDQYEAMEKAQREWEEKFGENNSSILDSFDQGNHSDITEERDESKAQTPCYASAAISSAQQDRSDARGVYLSEEVLNAGPRDNMPKSYDNTGYNNQNSTTVSTSGLLVQENSYSQLKGNQNKSPEKCPSLPSDRQCQRPCKDDFPHSKPKDTSPTDVYGGLPLKDASRNKNGQPHEFSGVLESLKHARLSLQQEIKRLPLVESGYKGKAIKPLAPANKSEDRYDYPVGCSGLFRVPTDFSDKAAARFKVHDSTSGFSSNLNLGKGISRTSGDQFRTNPYFGTMLSFSADNQSLATRYTETGSIFDTKGAPSVPFLDGGLFPGKYMFPTHSITSSYQSETPQLSLGEGLSRPNSSSTVGVSPVHHFSFHSDHVR